jgi:hypothetical protein
MTRLFILIATVFFLSSCSTEVEPESSVSRLPLQFDSEEEFITHVQEFQSDARISAFSESDDFDDYYGVSNITHYYKFKNPPPGANLSQISLGTTGANVSTIYYNPQHHNDLGDPERIMIQYSPYISYTSDDIETYGVWARSFRHEEQIREIDGIRYYIRRTSGFVGQLWAVEWVNSDGYYMGASFPYRFTADEVLGYVSDLERVEIGG